MFASRIYKSSPIWLQERVIGLRAEFRKVLREGRQFQTMYKEVLGQERLSRSELEVLQLEKLTAILSTARKHVPYYSSIFHSLGITELDICSFSDFAKLPILTKTEVANNYSQLQSTQRHWPIFSSSTSGTTGTPLKLSQDLAAINWENAFIWRQLKWTGFRNGDRTAWIRGDMIVPIEQVNPPYWRLDRWSKMLMMSSYHLSESNAPHYIQALQQWQPRIIQAYPSSVVFLAKFLDGEGLSYSGQGLKAIVTSSETLLPWQRELVENVFGVQVFDWYGNAERVVAIGTCERRRYHVMSDYGHTEFVKIENDEYEIVSTGFNNQVMPLIRYRTGDRVELGEDGDTCDCGRSFPIVKRVMGRVEDNIKTPEGRSVGRLDHIFKGVVNVVESQLEQNSIDELIIRVVPAANYSTADRDAILKNTQERLGSDITISIEEVVSIPRTKNGKVRFVVSNV